MILLNWLSLVWLDIIYHLLYLQTYSMPTQECRPECKNCGESIPHEQEHCPKCGLTPAEVEHEQWLTENGAYD